MFRSVMMFQGPSEVTIRRGRKLEDGTEDTYEVRKSELSEVLGNLEDTGSLV
jgi:hypothetical protein